MRFLDLVPSAFESEPVGEDVEGQADIAGDNESHNAQQNPSCIYVLLIAPLSIREDQKWVGRQKDKYLVHELLPVQKRTLKGLGPGQVRNYAQREGQLHRDL